MSLSKKQISSVVHLLNDTTQRLIDAVDNDPTLTIQEISVMRNRLCKEICDINMDDILSVDKNARRLLLKRGSGAENNAYVGMSGEVTVDTDAKTLRVHDGTTAGGVQIARIDDIPDVATADYVVAWQDPTEQNNYTWYRKYKSGWVEQGGVIINKNNGQEHTIYLSVEMQDESYMYCDYFEGISAYITNAWQIKDNPNILTRKTVNSFSRYCPDNAPIIRWRVSGVYKNQ